jgi:cytochrome P450
VAAARFDPYDPATQDDPFPVYEVLRRDHPCYRDPEGRFSAISRYDDVREALRDHETFSNAGGIILGNDVSAAPPSMVLMDPPAHTRLRNLVSRAFTPRRIAAFEDALRESISEFIDAFADQPEVDLVPAFADLVPVRAISDIVGVPREEREQFRMWADRMIGEPETEAGINAMIETFTYFGAALEDRKVNPRDDMLTAMTEAEIDGERLSLDEQVGMVLLLFFAGIETTVFHMTNVCFELGAHPEIQARLRDRPELIPDAMEEILRYDAPVQGDIRTLTRDVELHGEHMPAGETVLVLFGSANRDPKAFTDPDTLDITRKPNPHLTFAQGVHFCLGAPLVRLEHRIAFEELLRRLPPFRVVSERVRRRHLHGPFMRGLESVPVTFGD